MKIWRLDVPLRSRPIISGGAGWPLHDHLDEGDYMPPSTDAMPIEWVPSVNRVADFFWPVLMLTPVGRQEAVEAVTGRFTGAVQVDAPYVKPNDRVAIRIDKPKSPILKALWITKCVDADEDKSSIVREDRGESGTAVMLKGIDARKQCYEVVDGKDVHFDITMPRKPGCGVFVSHAALDGCDLFRVNQNRNWLFCTDRVKQFVEEQGFAGLDFLEAGDVLTDQ